MDCLAKCNIFSEYHKMVVITIFNKWHGPRCSYHIINIVTLVSEKINFPFQPKYFRTHIKGLFKQPRELPTDPDDVGDCIGGGSVDIPKRRCITLANFLVTPLLFWGAVSLLVLIPGCFSIFWICFFPIIAKACKAFSEGYTTDRRLGLESMVFGDLPTYSLKCHCGPLFCLGDNLVSSALYSPGYNSRHTFIV